MTTPTDDGDAIDVIKPIGYQPRRADRTRRFPLTPVQLVLIGVSIPVLVVVWFLFTAKSVRLTFEPAVDSVSISGGLSFELGGVYLLRKGSYRVLASADGYYPLDATLSIGGARDQAYAFALEKLPGRVSITSRPDGALVTLNGNTLGTTPISEAAVPAGAQQLRFELDRYQPLVLDVDVTGMNQPQQVTGELRPDWADVTVSSIPSGAEVFVDDQPTGVVTPGTVEVPTGEREIRISAPGHKSYRQRILVAAEEKIALEPVTLEKADGVLRVTTVPAGAGVTLNGQFEGETPLEIAIRSGVSYRVQVFKAGYAAVNRKLSVSSGEQHKLELSLKRLMGDVVVISDPPDAQLFVDGQPRGSADQTVRLSTVAHRIEIKKDGYAGYSTEITPRDGLTQEVKVRLLTHEEARLAALTPTIRTSQGQDLVLLEPGPFEMGASRRQPGRRANETLRSVNMTRLFYLGTREVTNAEFKAFAPNHDSGSFQEQDLSKDDQPVVQVSWQDAALYCNWLSDRDKLPRFYNTKGGKVVGVNPRAIGYRLPTEAEWAWAARQVDTDEPPRFPWGGALPPPDRYGNFADHSAGHLVGRVIFGYNDNYIVAAPVGTFAPTVKGLYDMAGNVAEWISDFYEIPGEETVTDPLGPETGDYHVIRGSSWMHGTITELRISFRDYGREGRQDVGFRLARFAESL